MKRKFVLLYILLNVYCLTSQAALRQDTETTVLNTPSSSKNSLNVAPPTVVHKKNKLTFPNVVNGIAIIPNILSLGVGVLHLVEASNYSRKRSFHLFAGISSILTSVNNLVKTRATYKNQNKGENHKILHFIKDVTLSCSLSIATILFWKDALLSDPAEILIGVSMLVSSLHALWNTFQEGKKLYALKNKLNTKKSLAK